MATATRQTTYRVMRPFSFQDFSGGWNIRDAPSELADNESPNLVNVTLTERGGVVKRLGYVRLGSGTGLSGPPSNVFYWKTNDWFIIQDGAAVKRTADFINFLTIHTWSTSATASFVDYQGLLVAVHPVDGVAVWTGTAWNPITPSPKGSCIAVWQNKVWISGDPTAPARVYASALPTVTTWPPPLAFNAADYNDMAEKNHAPVTALGVGQGMDVLGQAGLLVFKKNWIGRIDDSKSGTTFGHYTTLHNEAGACSAQSVTSTLAGVTCSINERGIWAVAGNEAPQLVSGKLDPLFEENQLNFAMCHKWCAEHDGNNVIFSVSRFGSDVNNLLLQYNPSVGWIVPHDLGFSSMALYSKNTHVLYAGSTTEGKVFQMFSGWSDDGQDIACRFQTKWFEPQGGYSCRLRRMRIKGRGTFLVQTKKDFTNAVDSGQTFISALGNPYWGTAIWGQFEWGAQPFEAYNDMYSWGVAKSFAVVVTEKSQLSAYVPTLLGDPSTSQTGSFGLYGVLLDYVRLGYS